MVFVFRISCSFLHNFSELRRDVSAVSRSASARESALCEHTQTATAEAPRQTSTLYLRLPTLRRVTMNTFEYFFGRRDFCPLPVGLPHMETARRRPRPWRPSPPPCGWSTGFIADPRTVGRTPVQRVRPAFPYTNKLCSLLETCPTLAQHALIIFRIVPDGSLTNVYPESCAMTSAAFPADRTRRAPLPE